MFVKALRFTPCVVIIHKVRQIEGSISTNTSSLLRPFFVIRGTHQMLFPSRWPVTYVVVVFSLLLGSGCRKLETMSPQRTGAFSVVFGGSSLTPKHFSPNVAYDLLPGNEKYFMYVPPSYTGSEPYGLIVFTYADPQARLPVGWQPVLDARKYIFVAAENAGNDQPHARRLGLAVMGALKVIESYHIDPNRVYAAGFSVVGKFGFPQIRFSIPSMA